MRANVPLRSDSSHDRLKLFPNLLKQHSSRDLLHLSLNLAQGTIVVSALFRDSLQVFCGVMGSLILPSLL